MKKLTITLLIALILSCAVTWQKGVCRHTAPYAAMVWSDMTGDPVGIIVGFTEKARHAQAFTVDSTGKIQWLVVYDEEVRIGKKDNFHPYEFVTVIGFIKKELKIKEFSEEELDKLLKYFYK